jgi:hypothetical protein
MHVQHDAADAVGRLYADGADKLRAAARYGLLVEESRTRWWR